MDKHYQYALSYINEGKLKQALTELDTIINHEESSIELQYKSYVQKLHAAQDKIEQNNISAIMIDKFHSTELAAQVLSEIAHFHQLSGEYNRHVGALMQLEAIYPDHEREWVIFSLAKAYHYFTKDIAQAISYYTKYLNEFGRTGLAYGIYVKIVALNLADCFNAINQSKEARRILKKYIE